MTYYIIFTPLSPQVLSKGKPWESFLWDSTGVTVNGVFYPVVRDAIEFSLHASDTVCATSWRPELPASVHGSDHFRPSSPPVRFCGFSSR